jgi:limonene-1,2-epoxide hydrolase
MTAEQIVDEFIRLILQKDLDGALALCTDDLEYDNVPMEALHGRDAARAFLSALVTDDVEIDWVVHRQVASATTVLNERTDSFVFGGGAIRIDLPVAGVFEVRDGRIALWRDYFDLRTFEQQMAGGAS